MKSLDIVNDKIAELKDTYQHYTAVEKDKAKASFAKFDIEQFQQIKQHLEILEILLIKSVDLEDLFYLFNKYPEEEDEYILECYNDCHKRKLTMEELQKIK